MEALDPARLRRRCDPNQFAFETTAELAEPCGLIGQPRAAEALEFGLAMAGRGFNVYAAGAPGTGRSSAVRGVLAQAAAGLPTPPDWCYVHNFAEPSRPRALRLPPGAGRKLRDELRALIQAARREIPRSFESEEYIAQREAIVGDLNRQRDQGFAQLASRAQLRGFTVQPTPMGIGIAPVLGNRPLSEEEVANLRPEMRESIQRNRTELEADVRAFLKDLRSTERQVRVRLEAQDRDVALHAVGGLVEDLADDYTDVPAISAFLAEVREGILADIALFRGHPLPTDGSPPAAAASGDPQQILADRAFHKYEVNVIVDNGDRTGAPVVRESNPTYPNLVGRIEREALLGALVTDVSLIGPGALHRANGGFLVLRAEEILRVPASWDALKRSLREGVVAIEDVSEVLGLTGTRGLRPDPIPLNVKVFLIGDPGLYQLLSGVDPDFRLLFKVRADFDTEMERSPANEHAYAIFVAASGARLGRPVERGAVALIVEESSRFVASQRKLSARFGPINDLVAEAAHWAEVDGATAVGPAHVRRAIAERFHRSDLIQKRIHELIARGVLLVSPTGAAVGQVHGLAVVGMGDVAFGQPMRITATVGAGRDGLLDIERQADLGGRIHSKGVLILGGYLNDRYAQDRPLAISARLVFEQSYAEVEGDSASLAELLALLSRLSEVPLRQGLAVTGSVNQRGEVQAVGGVNEKIEGFFDACQALGLHDDQGVVLPASNVDDLMLREDIVAAAAEGRFKIYAVHSVDEALAVLAVPPAGGRRRAGPVSPTVIHKRVEARLARLTEALRELGLPPVRRRNGAEHAVEPVAAPSPARSDGPRG